MPVTDMTRIDDAPKRIHEQLPAGKSASTQYARFGHFLTNKLLLEDPTRNLIHPLKAIFLIAGIVICVLCGSTQESKAALQAPSIATDVPFYYQYCRSAVFWYSTWLALPNAWYWDNAYAFWCYYLANYFADWCSFSLGVQPALGQLSDKKLSSLYLAPQETAHDMLYNEYSEIGDYYYRIYNGERPVSASAAP
jgi:hypothetical protein